MLLLLFLLLLKQLRIFGGAGANNLPAADNNNQQQLVRRHRRRHRAHPPPPRNDPGRWMANGQHATWFQGRPTNCLITLIFTNKYLYHYYRNSIDGPLAGIVLIGRAVIFFNERSLQ